ncbi:MAG: FAD-dependent oxidoreductase [Planctomycetaceae bacterium]|nr:FAD-dependent oxidoreductase [Planctomycetaceae bacterium]
MRINLLRHAFSVSLVICLFIGGIPSAILAKQITNSRLQDIEVDVCVYGGTSGGVIAAVQAARMGKRVALLEPGRNLGGMTSGGLSAVDIGDPRSIGGLTREFFTRLVATYGKTLNWGQKFQGNGGPATGGAYSIEPHVAEQLFDQMVREAGVILLKEARLTEVEFNGKRLEALHLESGRYILAKMFIDTTYEGDLMAAAEVSYTLMREGNRKYGERYNGIYYSPKYRPRTRHLKPGDNGRVPGGQGVWDRDFPLDPYVVPGDPTSGLLNLVNPGDPGTPGEAAAGIQAYCYRLCLTDDPANRIAIAPPEDYRAEDYELVVRFIQACLKNGDNMDLRWFSKHDPLPNQKWDFNTATFGGNLPGENWNWPEADYEERKLIAKKIEDYHRGLFHFLTTDPRVPEKVKQDASRFGLPKDEFIETKGWPHQLYIREGRRMVSDFVMTEHHTFGREVAADSIGLGSYGTDAHEIRRIVKGGVVTREGKIATGRGGFGPYQISYRAIVPKRDECQNLFVTFALSASHSAFASIRMEPVFMVSSQSAATAACLAIDDEIAVQEIDYERLKARLLSDGQILTWEGSDQVRQSHINQPESLPGLVLDETQATYEGQWTMSRAQPPWIGPSYRHDGRTGRGEKNARFEITIPEEGIYQIRLFYTHHENRASNVPVKIITRQGTMNVKVNQRNPAVKNGLPLSLARLKLAKGEKLTLTISNESVNGFVSVDGLQLIPDRIAQLEKSAEKKTGFEK